MMFLLVELHWGSHTMLCIQDQVIRMEKKRKYSFQGHQKFNLILQLSHHHCPLVKPGVCLTSVRSRQLIQGFGFLLQFLKRQKEFSKILWNIADHTFLVSWSRLSKLRTSLLEMFALSPARRSPYWSEYLEIVLIEYSWFQSVLF